MELRSKTWRYRLRRHLPAIAVLALGLGATALVARYSRAAANATDQVRFDESADRTVQAIQVRMDAYISALYSTRAFLDASDSVDRAAFRAFVDSVEVNERYRGIQGIGFAEVLSVDEIPAWEKRLAAEGLPDVAVFPLDPPRELYSAITYLEPYDLRNRRAVGYDMLSEPVRRAAMMKAKATGAPAASGPVTLVQEIDQQTQPGFLIYLAVFRGARQHLGWVYSPFRAHDLLHGIFPARSPLDFQVFAGTEAEAGAMYFDDGGLDAPADGPPRPMRGIRALEVAGVPWTVRFTARPEFYRNSSRNNAWWVAGLGSIASLLLYAIARLQGRARELAEARQRRTSFMAEAARALNESLDYSSTLDRLAQLCVRTLADWCIVHLKDDDGKLRHVALAHRDPAMTELGWQASRRFPDDPDAKTGVANVVRTNRSELTSEVPAMAIEQSARGPEHLAILRKVQIRSYMCVPLEARGAVIGAITFISSEPGRFQAGELAIAEELARLAASAVDNSRLYHRAQQAVKIRDEFLSVASHELKTPITSMTLKLDAMKRFAAQVEVDPRRKRSEEVLERQIRRLTRLVDSLLDVSRISAGRLRLELEDVDLVPTIREVVSSLQEELPGPAAIHVSVPDSLRGRWDRMRTEQVITNLLTNALKYGEGKPVLLTMEDAGDRARIIVRDQGIGISPADLDRVFERFERAVPATNYGGLGLGLYIARQIVEALGGTIAVTSAAGEGSTFTVELPKHPPVTPAAVQGSEKPLHH